MKKLIWAALALSVLVAPVFAANEGTAVGVKPDAKARIQTRDRVLIAGDGISVGERLVTGPSGQVQIIFADDTHLVVGPNSSLLIETYLMRNDGTAEKLAINALAGSFRFITGHSPKAAYQINTPTAAIAVRGTKFDIVVSATQTGIMLYDGALQLCGSGADCAQLTDRCSVGMASAAGARLFARNDPDRPPLALYFRYARVQAHLLAAFRISGASQCVSENSGAGAGQLLVDNNNDPDPQQPGPNDPTTGPNRSPGGKN